MNKRLLDSGPLFCHQDSFEDRFEDEIIGETDVHENCDNEKEADIFTKVDAGSVCDSIVKRCYQVRIVEDEETGIRVSIKTLFEMKVDIYLIIMKGFTMFWCFDTRLDTPAQNCSISLPSLSPSHSLSSK